MKYLYQEENNLSASISNSSQPLASTITLTSQDLRILPNEWLQQVREAALIADYMVLQDLIGEIERDYDEIANELKNWLQEFRMDKIAEIAKEASIGNAPNC